MRSVSALAFAAGVVAQTTYNSSQYLNHNPGGALPVGIPQPNLGGFSNPQIHLTRGGLGVCVSGTVPVRASAQNLKLDLQVPANQTALTGFIVDLVSDGSPVMKEIMGGKQNISGLYHIGATLCTGANDTKPEGVQFLTHGVGFNHVYWDLARGYSYADAAIKNGYAAFYYDRLGVGLSEKPQDGLNTVQSPLEVEIANQLALALRNGSFSGHSFSKVVGVGHSFGSIITQAITAKHPNTLDAAILTGFSTNSSGNPAFFLANNFAIASQAQPFLYSGLNNSYYSAPAPIANQIAFYRAPGFDPATLELALGTAAGTVTLGELLTTNAVVTPALNWTKPVAIVNGAEDLPFCDGNCTYPVNKAQAALTSLYNGTTKTGVYLAPTTGHGVNLHYSAEGSYHYIQEFINKYV